MIDIIHTAAVNNVPNKKINGNYDPQHKPKKDRSIFRKLWNIQQLFKNIKKIGDISDIPISKAQERIEQLNECLAKSEFTQELQLSEFPTENIAHNNRIWYKENKKIVRKVIDKIRNKQHYENIKEIEKAIENRCAMIDGKHSKFINSLLEKKREKITIDRALHYNEHDINKNHPTLLLSPQEVNTQASNVFSKQFRKRNHGFENISEEWKRVYKPFGRYNNLFINIDAPPTTEEWRETIKDMPNESAAGPSGLGYKLFKELPTSLIEGLCVLFGKAFKDNIFSEAWKRSNILPIPKPKPWGCDISNTRPIALLECCRKICTKILNNRLGDIIKDNGILKGLNFCGLKEESTNDPIHIINNIVEDAIEKKKELWLCFQDMSKAYDSISITGLGHALRRIDIPENIIGFLTNLFRNRSMKIITAYGLSPEFVAGDGVDQGDTISPLLWKIFYDPLLCTIQSHQHFGYTIENRFLKTPRMLNKWSTRSERIAALAFMDDTVWVNHDRDGLQKILDKSQEFFTLNDIQINGDKSMVLHINYKGNTGFVTMGSERNRVKMDAEKEIRYLGIFLNQSLNKSKVIKRINNLVDEFVKIVEKKSTSIEQYKYLVNKVLIPKIEYLTKTKHLPKKDWDKIFSKVLRLFKRKCGLARNTSTSSILHEGIIGLNSLHQKITESQISELIIRLNDKNSICSRTTLIRLFEAQLNLSEPAPLLTKEKEFFEHHKCKNNFNFEVLREAKLMGFDFDVNPQDVEEFSIDCKGFPLRKILDKNAINLSIPRKLNLFSLAQITDPNGTDLLTWDQVKSFWTIKNSCRGRQPKWFKKIEETVLSNNLTTEDNGYNRKIKDEFLIYPEYKELPYQQILPNKNRNTKEWVKWKTVHGWKIGRIEKKLSKKTEIREHKITNDKDGEIYRKILKKMDDDNSLKVVNRHSLHVVHTKPRKMNERFTTELITPINCEGQSFFLTKHKDFDVLDTNKRSLKSLSINLEGITETYINNWVENAILREEMKTLLGHFKSSNYNYLDFYTDESLKEGPDKSKLMAAAFYESNSSRSLSTSITHWPSSTRPELNAILLALLVTPEDKEITIKSDSQAAIDSLKSILNSKKGFSARKILKLNNRSTILKCATLTKNKNIKLTLVKIKGHSGIKGNEIADNLAKKECEKQNTFFKHDHINTGCVRFNPKFMGIEMDRNARLEIKKFHSVKNQCEWSLTNTVRRKIEKSTDWEVLTYRLFNEVKGRKCRSMAKSSTWRWYFKCFHDLLPTTKWLRIRHPSIYWEAKCPMCNTEEENYNHFYECIGYTEAWKEIQSKLKSQFVLLLSKILARNEKYQQTQRKIKLETIVSEILINIFNSLSQSQQIEAWMSCCIDQRYDNILAKLNINRETRLIIITSFLQTFSQEFKKGIWTLRCEKFIQWERSKNISQAEKKTTKNTRKKSSHTSKNLITRDIKKTRSYDDDLTEDEEDTFIKNLFINKCFSKDKRQELASKSALPLLPQIMVNNISPDWLFREKKRNFTLGVEPCYDKQNTNNSMGIT